MRRGGLKKDMLPFGLKIAWFVLSVTGLLSSFLGLSFFPVALNVSWVPIAYGAANTILQVMFCLGMVWKMDPYRMPSGFCTAQSSIMSLCWLSITASSTCITLATSGSILLPSRLSPIDLQSALRWRNPFLCLLIGFPAMSFAAYLVASLKLNAIQPSDSLSCDAVSPTWVRLLSYTGTPLILAVPSFLLSCTSGLRLLYNQSPDSGQHTQNLSSFTPQRDNLTPIPLRRQSMLKSAVSSSQDTGEFYRDIRYPNIPRLHVQSHSPITENSELSSIPTSGSVARAIPSPTGSLSFLPTTAGRLPSSPTARKSRYHLPFTWTAPTSRSSSESGRDMHSSQNASKTPSPLIFASPSAAATPRNSFSAERRLLTAERVATLSAALEKRARGSQEESLVMPDGSVERDDEDHSPGGSIRWARERDSDTSSIGKSELVFAAVEEGLYKTQTFLPPPEIPSGPFYRYRSQTQRLSFESSAWSSDPQSRYYRLALWRVLGFQLLSSATQVLAAFSSLIDMFTQHNPPSRFGTQHVALLLAAWAPAIAFGVVPWRRR